jgi:hypothetical protein
MAPSNASRIICDGNVIEFRLRFDRYRNFLFDFSSPNSFSRSNGLPLRGLVGFGSHRSQVIGGGTGFASAGLPTAKDSAFSAILATLPNVFGVAIEICFASSHVIPPGDGSAAISQHANKQSAR